MHAQRGGSNFSSFSFVVLASGWQNVGVVRCEELCCASVSVVLVNLRWSVTCKACMLCLQIVGKLLKLWVVGVLSCVVLEFWLRSSACVGLSHVGLVRCACRLLT